MPISSSQPANSDTTIDITMPRGPLRAASWVSSVMCAEASYPVKVYWARSRLSSSTSNVLCEPVALKVDVKTYDAEACLDGTNASTATMISTPRMCHQTLTSFSRETSRIPNWYNRPCTNSTIAKIKIVTPCAVLTFQVRFRNALMKNAAPKSMPAVTATCPRKLNQPVNQDQAPAFLR